MVTGVLWCGLVDVCAQGRKNGLILCKPHAWSADSEAAPIEYASYENHTGYWNVTFADGRQEQVFAGTIVKSIPYPDESAFLNLSNESEKEIFLSEITELKKDEKLYPATKGFLDPVVNQLQQQIDAYNQGKRKVNGAWITQAQLDKVKEEQRAATETANRGKQSSADMQQELTITTLDGTVYNNVKITSVEPDGLNIIHSTGAGKINFENLPTSLRAKYHYDTAAAAAYKKTKQKQVH